MVSKLLKAVAVGTVAFGCTQVMAHTVIQESPTTEGGSMVAGTLITHGCDGNAVRAQSVVWPIGDTIAKDGAGNPVDLSQHFEGVGSAEHGAQSLGLPLFPRIVADNDVFKTRANRLDAGGTVRAFHYDFGYLEPSLVYGHIPFRIQKPIFKATSCANKLVLNVAIANWCNKSQTDPARADIWMGTPTPLFNDNNGEVVSDNFWPQLVVNRTSPLPASCGGTGVTVTVSPSAATIDEFMPIKGYWPTP